MPNTTGEFQITNMSEETYKDLDGDGKITHASGTQAFSGGLTGEGAVDWLMCYRADGSARFVGLQRVQGSLDGKEGSFIVEAAGDFDGSESKGTWSVIANSGTGALAGLRGEGRFHASNGPTAMFSLDYELG
jgi:hypothetical protein